MASTNTIIDKFCGKYGTTAVRAFTRSMILKIIDKRCKTPAARRNWITTIKDLFSHAMPTIRKDILFDAIDGAKVAAMPKGNDGHHSWKRRFRPIAPSGRPAPSSGW